MQSSFKQGHAVILQCFCFSRTCRSLDFSRCVICQELPPSPIRQSCQKPCGKPQRVRARGELVRARVSSMVTVQGPWPRDLASGKGTHRPGQLSAQAETLPRGVQEKRRRSLVMNRLQTGLASLQSELGCATSVAPNLSRSVLTCND